MIYFGDVLYKDHPNAININWEITGVCPYKCVYCDRYYKREKISFDIIQKACIYFKKIYGDIFYQICITGGEPTTRSDFSELINMFNNTFVNNRIVLLTNMFFSKRMLYIKYTSIQQLDKIIYVGSLHLDKVNKIEEFFEKARYMNTLGFLSTQYKIIVTSWGLEKAKKIIHKLETQYTDLLPYIRMVRNFHETFDMPVEFKKYMSLDNIIIYRTDYEEKTMSYNSIKDLNLNKTKGMKCMLGRQNLYICTEGNVYGSLITPLCLKNKHFGCLTDNNDSVFENLDNFLKTDIIECEEEYCQKECLMVIPKYK